MSAQQLADRCAELGLPINRSVLANLESGRRPSVSVAELLVLARALDTAPALLLFPPGRHEMIELLPDSPVPVFDALRWFAADGPWPGSGEADVNRWRSAKLPADLFRSHAKLLAMRAHAAREAADSRWRAEEVARSPGQMRDYESTAETYEAQMDDAGEQLITLRHVMRERGLTPPELPADLAYVDEDDGAR